MLFHIISILALLTSLFGNVLINYKKRVGFIVWFVSNVLWIVSNIVGTVNPWQIGLFLVYMCLNVQGWLNWKKAGR